MKKRLYRDITKLLMSILIIPLFVSAGTKGRAIPIMMGDMFFFQYKSFVKLSLGADKNIDEGDNEILSPSISSHASDIRKYEWSINGKIVGTSETFSTSGLSVGTHTITVTITDKYGYKVKDTITIVVDDKIDESDLNLQSDFVGTTQGEFGVNQGIASYSIKIDVPPGVGGMDPELSLDYSSSAGNGYMGMGWNIGGLGSISRCPQNKATDGKDHAFGVKYNDEDRFCLDGQRLISIDGVYGKNATEYRTEINSYKKIRSYTSGDYPNSPAWFEVKTKSGLIYRYGETSQNAYKSIGNKKMFWSVSSIRDVYGNSIKFKYKRAGGNEELFIDTVSYADNSVKYIYEERDDHLTSYSAGVKTVVSKRLRRVEVKQGSKIIRTYKVAYKNEYSGRKRSRVVSITEGVPSSSLKKLLFDWQKSDIKNLTYKDMNIPFASIPYTVKIEENNVVYTGFNKNDKGVQFADINADGFADIVQLYINKDGTHIRKIYLNDGDTFSLSNAYTNGLPDVYFTDSEGQSMGTRLADINADGLIDIIQLYLPDNSYYNGVAQQHVWLNTGSGFELDSSYSGSMSDIYFTGKNGQDMGTRMADINGDGMVDLIQLYIPNDDYYEGAVQKRVYLNNGTKFVYNATYSNNLPHTYFAGKYGQSLGTQLVDVDGNGLLDLMQMYIPNDSYYAGKAQKHIYLNNGKSFVYNNNYSKHLPNTYFNGQNGQSLGTQMQDINGDGLTDIIQLYVPDESYYGGEAQRRVYVNNGQQFIYHNNFSSSLPDAYFVGRDGQSLGTRLADMNGDGYVDIIQLYLPNDSYYNGVPQRRVLLNAGNRFIRSNTYSSKLSDTYFARNDGKDMGTQLVDIDGDGSTDIVQFYSPRGSYYEGLPQRRVYVNENNALLMTSISNGIDQDIKIKYKKMTNPLVYKNYSTNGERNKRAFNKISNDNIELTLPKDLVYSVKQMDGIGGYNELQYKYFGYIFNKVRGSQGFHKIESYDVENAMTSSVSYKQIENPEGKGFQYTGLPYFSFSGKEEGKSYYLSDTTIKYKDAKRHPKLYEPYTSANIQSIFDPDSRKMIKTISHYNEVKNDAKGNVVKSVDKIVDLLSGEESKITIINEYNQEDTNKWQLGRITKATVTHSKTGKDDIVRVAKFHYDSNGVLDKETALYGTSLFLTKAYTYDDYGNKESETVSGGGIQSATTTFTYSSDGKFLSTITDAGGYTQTKIYDARFGTIKSLTDANGLTTRWEYDELGRKIEQIDPDGTKTKWKHLWGHNFIGAENAVYSVAKSSKTEPFSRVYYDGLGRDVGSYTYTMKKGNRKTYESRRIVKRKYYTNKGELEYEELPHYQADSNIGLIHNYYDSYGRVIKVTKPGPGNTLQEVNTAYANFTQTITDAKNVQKKIIKNAFDEVIQIIDANDEDEASSIHYAYDAIGNLIETKDSKNHKITMEYNEAGYKKSMNDPALGEWHYLYNALGKLRWQWSGANEHAGSKHATTKRYDILGRITQEVIVDNVAYHKDSHNYGYTQTDYEYGSSQGSKGSRGKLTYTKTQSRIKDENSNAQKITYSYDGLGRTVQTKTRMGGKDYISKVKYDAYSRPTTLTYPNGYAVTNYYKNSILDTVVGSDGKVHYQINSLSAFGEIESASFANGVKTSIGHDNAGFTGMIVSGHSSSILGNVQRLDYTYDILGNVLEREDNSIIGKHITDTFTYDSMNRLYSQSTESDVDGVYAQSKQYRYDVLGNMRFQSGLGNYTYYADKPHAVKDVGNRHYEYDSVGNMTYRNGDSITYNTLNKPAVLKNHSNNKEVRFYYGVGGARYQKNSEGVNTYYLGKAYEAQIAGDEETQTCYISLGGKTIGTHTQVVHHEYDINKNNVHYKDPAVNHYFHTDALGSITAITDDSGKVIERRSYEPFGKIRAMDYGLTSNHAIIPANTVEQSTRAFTGHEQIAELSGLIHMNARVYDSDIGRFLSADTLIQSPHDSQSYNRYSYVRNNPLALTDPSGHSWWSRTWKKIENNWRTIVSIVVTVVIAVYAPYLLAEYSSAFGTISATGAVASTSAGVIVTGALAGFAGGAIATGSLKGALKGAFWGAVSAGVANEIGHGLLLKSVRESTYIAKSVLHGLSRAAISKLQFGSGKGSFLSGMASSLFGGFVADAFKGAHTIVKTAMVAIAGGTASRLGGGKFANGAMGAAFVMLFNDLQQDKYWPKAEKMRNFKPASSYLNAIEANNKARNAIIAVSLGFGGTAIVAGRYAIATLLDKYVISSMDYVAVRIENLIMGNPIETMAGVGVADNMFMGGTPAGSVSEWIASQLHDYNPWAIK